MDGIEDRVESVVGAANQVAGAWKTILVALGVSSVVGVVALLGWVLYDGRDRVATLFYESLSGHDLPDAGIEWLRIPPEAFPEFWVCDPGGCKADIGKRAQILKILEEHRKASGSPRMGVGIYTNGYRRVAAQVHGEGVTPLPESLWVVSTDQPGLKDPIPFLAEGECHSLRPADLPAGSFVEVEARKLGVDFVIDCPVRKNSELIGYVSIQSSTENLTKSKLAALLAAAEVQAAFGW